MNVSKAIRQYAGDVKVWQRGYYDHVIRNQADYDEIANYISENPLRWELDKLYSEDLCWGDTMTLQEKIAAAAEYLFEKVTLHNIVQIVTVDQDRGNSD